MRTQPIPVAVFVVGFAGSVAAQPVVLPGPSHPVQVTNDSSSPVPVIIEGAPVPVTLQGTASIAGDVNVTNPSLPVVVLDDSINVPYVRTRTAFVSEPDSAGGDRADFEAVFSVQAGTRLIVESMSVMMKGGLLAEFDGAALLQFGDTEVGIPLQRSVNGSGFSGMSLAGTLPLKVRIDGPRDIYIRGRPTEFGEFETADIRASVFGYVVPLPE